VRPLQRKEADGGAGMMLAYHYLTVESPWEEFQCWQCGYPVYLDDRYVVVTTASSMPPEAVSEAFCSIGCASRYYQAEASS
jgi:hypothetical protein